MSKSRGGLGRGLAALIPTGPATNTVSDVFMGGAGRLVAVPTGTARHGASDLPPDPDDDQQRSSADAVTSGDGPRYADIPVTAIRPNPRNPRTVFDQDALDELAHSIREFGLLQPVVVRPVDGGYELVMGERRWRAAQQAGVETVAAIIRRTEDADLLRDALLENIHRTNLNPLEEAAAYQQLLEEFEVTQEELATRLGRSRPVISNTIRLLNLPIAVQRRVAAGVLSAGHARALLSLSEAGDQEDLAARIVAEGLSVRGAEEAVTLLARRTPTVRRSPARKMIMPGVQELATNLSDAFDTRVLVELGRRKGKIVVEFATVDDLERLVEIIAPAVAQRRKGLTPRPSAPSAPSAPNAPTAGTVGGNGTDPADSTGSPSGPAVGRNSGSIPPGTLTGPADSESTVAEADSGQTADSVGIADTAAGIADGVGIADTAGLSDNVGIADSARLVDSAALVVRAGWADLYEVTATGFPAEPTAADHEAHADAPNAPVVDAGSEPENLNNRDGWGETEDRGDQATTSAYTDASLSGIDGASDGDGTPDAPDVSVSAEVVRATGSTSEGSEAGSPESADRLSDTAIP